MTHQDFVLPNRYVVSEGGVVASLIGWLDYSEEVRRQMHEIVQLFRTEGSLDELGIGVVRDALADLLFPGLNTQQTRARYFLFVPWVCQRLEQERVPSSKAEARSRRWQTDLVWALERGGVQGGEGVFGWDSRENLQRLPAEIYWSGLKSFGIRLFTGSPSEYYRSLDDFHRQLREFTKSEGDEAVSAPPSNWTPHLPPAPSDLWQSTTLDLQSREAEFLRDQVQLHHPKTLFSWLLDHPIDNVREISFPWQHPAAPTAPDDIGTPSRHARLASEVVNGAGMAYTLMLAELAEQRGLAGSEGLVDEHFEALEYWASRMRSFEGDLTGWDLQEFWDIVRIANPRVSLSDQRFVTEWIMLVKADPRSVAEMSRSVRDLISDRELRKKRGKARLHNPRSLELWRPRVGLGQLDFRWSTARWFIEDVHRGLGLV